MMARFCEEVVVLGTTLFCSGFSAAGPMGKLVFGDDFEERVEQRGLFARFAMSGLNDLREVA